MLLREVVDQLNNETDNALTEDITFREKDTLMLK
jgi:hypothetical protein